jgi:hypothetical protein
VWLAINQTSHVPSFSGVFHETITGADPGFQARGGALKKIAPNGGRREHFWGISCEKSRFYAFTPKNHIFFQF